LSPSSVRILEQLDAPGETIRQLIGEALVHADPVTRSEAALAAQRYPDDRFMQPLTDLATTSSRNTRVRAIHALAYNRTDAGVATLRRLLEDPDAAIRNATVQAIEAAYRMSDTARGRPLRPDDFPDIARR
jgi:HEAT repeat protein